MAKISRTETENDSRKIASEEHNVYVLEGIDPHQSTKVAPSALLQPFDEATEERINSQYKSILEKITVHLGKPFYADSGFILYQGDLIPYLKQLSRSGISVDLTITSPPYNIGKEYENQMSVDEYINWCTQWMKLIHEVTQPKGSFWLNVGYQEVPKKGLCVPITYLLWDKSPFYLLQEIVWKYGAGVSTKYRLSPRNEKWLFYVKDSQNYTFNLDEIRDTNVKYPNQKKNGKYRCNPLGKNPSDVWDFPKVTTGEKRSSKERTKHPAQFPLGVVERVVKASSNPIEIVMDPFLGSGSTAIASVGLGRLSLGFEIRKDYCELAVERYKQFQKERQSFYCQGSLF
ncbi:site-specific DNA-methyltransferase [Oscillatoria sp. FACHB-1406]|uniref:DNA-methyltransferase n=1 Tax=Oscillatoria sp. FACHB-1406 TaxID=2692846 RepID=UPI0016869DD9|nr:site-specific DNA-methyltransferase [Oscillatoria sp. FACHB-1406]MBD2580286.1 site-specific DNA-methyltransferase [Oscillatoria sp. FACHB-1406]